MDQKEKWGLFWCRLLYPVIFEEEEKVTEYMKSLSIREILFPDGKAKKPSLATLWRKLKAYKEGSIEGLQRKARQDRGKIRIVDQAILEKAIEIKKDLPTRSHLTINTFLEKYCGKTIPKSTLYRHFKEAGATRKKLGIDKTKVRCRWTRDHSNSLWTGDFQHGPCVLENGQAYRTYLTAFIDVHSRFIVDARYYLRQNTPILIDTLIRAWSIHGIPRSLYVDNAKVYYADQLEAACYSLEIKLLHRPPREPETGGIIEKFFQTAQGQFESEVRAGEVLTLESLNRSFSAWLNVAYHETIHSETLQSPKERYEQGMVAKREVDVQAALRFFMKKAERKVHSDFSDVSLEGRYYKVDSRLRGDKVIVRWDEFSDLSTVLLYSLQDQYLGKGILYDREKEEQSYNPIKIEKPKHDYLALLIEKHEKTLAKQSQGIDYTYSCSSRAWPFLSFATTLARLLGRKGGASAFTTKEYESLKQIYERFPNLSENILTQAVENAEIKDIVNITYQLQSLIQA